MNAVLFLHFWSNSIVQLILVFAWLKPQAEVLIEQMNSIFTFSYMWESELCKLELVKNLYRFFLATEAVKEIHFGIEVLL